MGFIMEYVLGFAFDLQCKRVALIRKKRPDWQAGLWNGIGGHRNGNETGAEAMVREFMEETGVKTHEVQWRLAGTMRAESQWRVLVYAMNESLINRVKTTTDEQVQLFSVAGIDDVPSIPNVPALVRLCCMPKDHTDKIPKFELDYTRDDLNTRIAPRR